MQISPNKHLITLDGDEWVIVNVGVVDNDTGNVFCHLRSTTRFVQQKNGRRPVQIGDWLPTSLFEEAA